MTISTMIPLEQFEQWLAEWEQEDDEISKKELKEEIEKRAEVLWVCLGSESVVIKILWQEYSLTPEQAERILRRVRRRLHIANNIGPSEIK